MKFFILALIMLLSLYRCKPLPRDWLWGTATASYQVEGAWNVSGRGLTIWDIFSHIPGKVWHNQNGDVADEHYFRFPEDIARMKQQGFKAFRFSLAWSRIFPSGKIDSPLNQAGIDHYNDVINLLRQNDIEPLVTLYHWDLPQGLQLEGGWLNKSLIVPAFNHYADTCFQHFGDRVSYWLTINEPMTVSLAGFETGTMAPGRCSDRSHCLEGNSSTEPYIVSHNLILAHAAAVQTYRTKYQGKQQGKIGITLNVNWGLPYSDSEVDREAVQRTLSFQCGWYADPVWFGDYPAVMRQLVGNRLPEFSPAERQMVKGSHDFFGLNHYTTNWAQNDPNMPKNQGWTTDQQVRQTQVRNGVPIGPQAASPWLYVYPPGIRGILEWIFTRYEKTPIFITENGVDVPGEDDMPLAQALNDTFRLNYYRDYIREMRAAMDEGVDVRGYFAWSLMDNFEWADGYHFRFGINYVDYKDNLTRYEKDSAKWFTHMMQNEKKENFE